MYNVPARVYVRDRWGNTQNWVSLETLQIHSRFLWFFRSLMNIRSKSDARGKASIFMITTNDIPHQSNRPCEQRYLFEDERLLTSSSWFFRRVLSPVLFCTLSQVAFILPSVRIPLVFNEIPHIFSFMRLWWLFPRDRHQERPTLFSPLRRCLTLWNVTVHSPDLLTQPLVTTSVYWSLSGNPFHRKQWSSSYCRH